MSGKLARVSWQLGQTLLPDHFEAQEEAYLTDVAMRFQLCGKPFYGVGCVYWESSLLNQGTLQITQLSYIFKSGLLIALNENASLVSDKINFDAQKTVEIYIHVMQEKQVNKYIEFDNKVYKKTYKLVLSQRLDICFGSDLFDPERYYHIDTFKLANFKQAENKQWQLDNSYCPPLLQLGSSLFLKESISQLSKLLVKFNLQLKIYSGIVDGEDCVVNIKLNTQISIILSRIYVFMRLVHNIEGEVHVHPYDFFNELQTLYIDLLFYLNKFTENLNTQYEHEKIGANFQTLFKLIEELIAIEGCRYNSRPLELKNGIYSADLPEILTTVDSYYLFVLHKKQSLMPFKCPKLSSSRRLLEERENPIAEGVEVRKLTGIKKDDIALECWDLQGRTECFLLVQNIEEGSEWNNVLADKNIGYFANEITNGYEVRLVWESIKNETTA